VDRRAFIGTLAGGLLAAPLAAEGQQARRTYRIGLLGLASSSDRAGVAALREGLQEFGYEEGKNLVIEYRWAEGQYDRLPGFAAELVRLKVDVIVTYGTPGALAAKQATKTIPVVVAIMGDAVATGVVATLARPGGNVTGSQFHFPQIMVKRIELLREALPRVTRVGALVNVANPSAPPVLEAMKDAGRRLGVEMQEAEVRSPDDFGAAFATMAKQRSEAFIVLDDPMLRSHGRTIAEQAAQRQLPSVGEREYVESGGLLAYGVKRPEMWRRAAVFIDKIFKGAKPADLSFEQTDRLEMMVNLKTAKALGLTIPQSLLQRADQVIE
jgi:putative tryptophan/tyrosine transport system substrate-binding protein